MASGLPPPPVNDKPGSFSWMEWYRQLRNYVSTSGSVPWYIINFSGSNITDIAKRSHNTLQDIQGGTGGEYYHLTSAQVALIGSPAYGSFYLTTSPTTVTVSVLNTWYQVPSGMTVGKVSNTTFQNARELLIGTAGTYKIDWSMTLSVAAATQSIAGGIMKNASYIAGTNSNTNIDVVSGSMVVSGTSIQTLSTSDIISLCVNNITAANNISVTAANLVITKIGS